MLRQLRWFSALNKQAWHGMPVCFEVAVDTSKSRCQRLLG